MKKILCEQRPGWVDRVVNEQNLCFDHDDDNPDDHYWTEGEAYLFSKQEIRSIFDQARTLYGMCVDAGLDLLETNSVAQNDHDFIKRSYDNGEQDLFTRMDCALTFDDNNEPRIKLLEFNADTPLCIVETAVCQNDWQYCFTDTVDPITPGLGSALVARWTELKNSFTSNVVHIACMPDDLNEYEASTELIAHAAHLAGLEPRLMYVRDIFFNEDDHTWRDQDDEIIETLYKIYPWCDLLTDTDDGYNEKLKKCSDNLTIINPAWCSLMSSKELLATLWNKFNLHPNLLETTVGEQPSCNNWVRKPINGSCGRDVVVHAPDFGIDEQSSLVCGQLGEDVFQEFAHSIDEDGQHITLSVFFTGNTPVDLCIRRAENSFIVDDENGVFVPCALEKR